MESIRKIFLMICLLIIATTLNACLVIPIPYKGYPYKKITGRFIDETTNKPIENIRVHLQYVVCDFPVGKLYIQDTTSDVNGCFTLYPNRHWNLFYVYFIPMGPIGTYDLIARKDSYDDFHMILTIRSQRTIWGNYNFIRTKSDLGDLIMKHK